MPFRRLVFLSLLATLAGCMVQRDAAEIEPGPDTTAVTTTETPMTGGPGGAPNVAVYLDGTWDLTLVPREGGESVSGVWAIAEGGASRLSTSTGLDAPVRIAERLVSGDVFSVTGIVETAEGPASFEFGGTLHGHEMHGEARIEGVGTFDLAGTRRLD